MPAIALALLLGFELSPPPAAAQTCGSEYVIQEGESLAQIAQRVYGSSSQWSVIFYANQDRLGASATLLVPGQAIAIPCIGQSQQGTPASGAPATAQTPPAQPTGFVLSSMVRRIEFLTAEGYTPYTDRTLQNGGLMLDLLTASMDQIKEQAQGSFSFNISWVNDWAAHLNPLLITRAFDAGLPWAKLDCNDISSLDTTSQYKCQKFFFSDPFYEDVIVLFVKNESPILFNSDDEILGKTLCGTRGRSSFDLNKDRRRWISDNKIVLMQPQTPEECFRLLDEGTVDAVVISDLTGRAVATSMGMLDRVRTTERPVHIETLHAIIAKTHPHARTILYYINSSLSRLRESGEYDKIVSRHLERFWSSLDERQSPTQSSAAKETETKDGAKR
jgi:polar amino acid transport system substrate-binding protein